MRALRSARAEQESSSIEAVRVRLATQERLELYFASSRSLFGAVSAC
jgi:hypothetical protein